MPIFLEKGVTRGALREDFGDFEESSLCYDGGLSGSDRRRSFGAVLDSDASSDGFKLGSDSSWMGRRPEEWLVVGGGGWSCGGWRWRLEPISRVEKSEVEVNG